MERESDRIKFVTPMSVLTGLHVQQLPYTDPDQRDISSQNCHQISFQHESVIDYW